MVAIHIPRPAHDDWAPVPRPVDAPEVLRPERDRAQVRGRSLPDRATRVRRRRLVLLVAVVVLSVACALAVQAIAGLARVDGSSRPEPVDAGPAPVAGQGYVVQPGDTLWSIANEVAPDDDPRRVVDALREANGGTAELQVGTELVLDVG